MINFLRKLRKPKYETLNVITINASKLIANFNYLQGLQPAAKIFPVLKSNAYGHGLKEVCQILNKVRPALAVVDSYPEAQIAYRYFKGKILIMGEMPHRAYDYCKFRRTEFTVYNEETLRYLAQYGKRAQVHLFVNSGMNREGIKDLADFISRNREYLERVEVVGLCSHLASADQDSRLNKEQEDNFRQAWEILKQAGFNPRWVHLGNSAAVFTVKSDFLTAYRPGLSFYGYSPFADDQGRGEALQPALEVFSHIVSLQELKVLESVSYNETYQASQEVIVGVVPFGYFEGLDRRLSNRAKFLVQSENNNFWATIAGRVCMNLTCLEFGQNKPKIGDIVQLVSSKREDANSVADLAALCDTVPYEFLVKLQPGIRREIINN
jgi:alanine racemase